MNSPVVVVTATIDDAQRQVLETELPETVETVVLDEVDDDRRAATIERADVLVSWMPSEELTDEEFARLRDDQSLQVLSAGVDFVPFDRLPDGMAVLNNAGAYADPIAEHVLAIYLALSKRLLTEHRNMAEGEFNQFTPTRWVRGSVCGIFGFGAIGEAVARSLRALGVEVLAINRHGETDESVEFIGTPDDLDDVLAACDALVISAPLTPETKGAIAREQLERMADDAMLVNVARGEIVDQRDLYEHLRENPEFRAGLEAWWTEPVRHGSFELDYPFFDLPNVLGSPHNSAIVPDITELRMRHVAENVTAAVTSGDPERVVNRDLEY